MRHKLEFKAHRLRARLKNLDIQDDMNIKEEDQYKRRDETESELWKLEKELAGTQSFRETKEAELELLIKHARWD